MSIKSQILTALEDGPGLACELSCELEMNSRRLNAYLVDLQRQGFIKREKFGKTNGTRREVWLHSLKEVA